jgi:Flp pilus assembly protein TadD
MKRAVVIFLKALETAPGQPAALKGLGLAYSGLGDRQSAIDALRRYLQGRPDDPEAHYMLAGLYENSGMADSASQEYRTTLDILYSEYTGGGS